MDGFLVFVFVFLSKNVDDNSCFVLVCFNEIQIGLFVEERLHVFICYAHYTKLGKKHAHP